MVKYNDEGYRIPPRRTGSEGKYVVQFINKYTGRQEQYYFNTLDEAKQWKRYKRSDVWKASDIEILNQQYDYRKQMRKNPAALREFYFNDGPYEQVFTSEREAHLAAKKLATSRGTSVQLYYRDVGGNRRRVGTARYRNNPATGGHYPPIYSIWSKGQKHQSFSTLREAKEFALEYFVSKGWDVTIRNNLNDKVVFLGAHEHVKGRYRKNPATLGGSVMAHKYRALPYAEALKILRVKASQLQEKEATPTTRQDTTTVHSVEVTTRQMTGYPSRHVVTESFATKKDANDFAKSARAMGLAANVG